jgi:hypothetical protein
MLDICYITSTIVKNQVLRLFYYKAFILLNNKDNSQNSLKIKFISILFPYIIFFVGVWSWLADKLSFHPWW